ncbi:hypothetical protein CF8_0117 [Aeromonas phage CF8]|nr:hypothetical protein CF8_0117 [Aeromonas phage CF8]
MAVKLCHDTGYGRVANAHFGFTTAVSNGSDIALWCADKCGLITMLPPERDKFHPQDQGRIKVTRAWMAANAAGMEIKKTSLCSDGDFIYDNFKPGIERFQENYNRYVNLGQPDQNAVHSYFYPPEPGECYVNHALGIIIARCEDLMRCIRREGFWPREALAAMDPTRLGDDQGMLVLNSEEEKFLTAKILIVDKLGRTYGLWTHMLGRAFQIPVIRSSSLKDGIYIDASVTGKPAGHTVHISFDDDDYEKQLKEHGIFFESRDAEIGKSSKAYEELQVKLDASRKETATLKKELTKKTKEFEVLQRAHETQANESKLFKSNRTGNFILDYLKFLFSIFGAELKGSIMGLIRVLI